MSSSSVMGLHLRAMPNTPENRVIRNHVQLEQVKQLWIFLCSVLAFFTAVNFARWSWSKLFPPSLDDRITSTAGDPEKNGPSSTGTSIGRRIVDAAATGFRIVFFRKSIRVGFGTMFSVTELTFIFTYITANILFLFLKTYELSPMMFQDRAAHLAASQLPIVVALAGKNNVISWLTGIGHERLNVLHRAAARTLLIMLWIHALQRIQSGLPPQFDFTHNWMRSGAVGLGSFTLAAIFALRPVRNMAYEFFLVSHIVFVFIFLVAGFFHTRALGRQAYIWPALLIWGFDRFLRLSRLVWNNKIWDKKHPGNASVELLSENTIRLTLRRRGITWKPGQHAYVILPSVSSLPFEAHPFTIASIPEVVNDKGERDAVFLIRGRNGFTARLRKHAAENPNCTVPAFLDGPYGCPPNLRVYSTCVLVAGGSGISYTLPLLLDLARASSQGEPSAVRRIVFVWATRNSSHLAWISKAIVEASGRVKSSLIIEPKIYITGGNYPIPEVPELSKEARDSTISTTTGAEKKSTDSEQDLPVYSSLKLIHGRPSMKKLLHDEIEQAKGPISVDVAGPSSLSEAVRRSLGDDLASPLSVLKGSHPVTLHVETFGLVKN